MAEAVRLVVWDLEETFWKGTLTEGGIQEYVQAHHDIVIELARRGILSSICSKNDSATILAILEEKGIRDYFIFPSISWEPKGMRLAQLVETVQLRAPTVMFIDDNPNNRAEAAAVVPGLQIEDETFIPKMLDDPRFKGKDDSELTRLKQYKLLEERKRDEEQAAGGNEEFLRGCGIKVYIEYDIESNIDRAIELINRTNQLNYTKKRLPEDKEAARNELLAQMRPFDRFVGLVKVADKYGNYGFVGFFMGGGRRTVIQQGAEHTHLVHYCFSCRTLGMLVEHWLYNYLGRPELNVVGEVLTDLSVPRDVDWIQLVHNIDDNSPQLDAVAPKILLYGGCEANVIGIYLKAFAKEIEIQGNYAADGIFSRINYAARLLDIGDRDTIDFGPEAGILKLPLELEVGDVFSGAPSGTLYVINLSADAHGTIRIRHKENDWTFVIEPNGFSLTAFSRMSEPEFVALLDSRNWSFSDKQREHLLQVRRHIQNNYEEIIQPGPTEIMQELRMVIERVPQDSKLIIITDHDQVRKSAGVDGMKHSPGATRYRQLAEEVGKKYGYVATISISDMLSGPEDVLEENHYTREVYLRLAVRIADLARDLEPRLTPPVSKRRLARIAAAERAQAQWSAEAGDLINTCYEALLRRKPDSSALQHAVNEISKGRMSPANFLGHVTRSSEFQSKWAKTDPLQASSRLYLIDPVKMGVPQELVISELHPKRVLVVGSCLSEEMIQRMRLLPDSCQADLYFAGADLPNLPQNALSDYDFLLVQLALRHILPDAAFARLGSLDTIGHTKLFDHATSIMLRHLEIAMRWNREHGVLTIVFPFIVPMKNPIGRLLPRYELENPVFFIEELNKILGKEIQKYANTYFLDINEVLSFHGRRFSQDDGVWTFNHGGFLTNFDAEYDVNRLEPAGRASDYYNFNAEGAFLAIWEEVRGLYRTIRQIDQIKMVVLDLDDTLWRGVVAEVEVDAMPTTEGWPKGVWEALLVLKRRGVLLAIISKNEEARVLEVWDKVFGRRLSLDDFAIRKINWRPKPENMSEILAHVNLLPGNVLYIDDNPAERAAMKGAFPDIRVLGGTPLTWRRILLWSSETQVPTITAESAARTDMVRAQVVREEQRATMSREEFLASLNVRMTLFEVQDADHPRFPRVFELINKTNQFNTTGQRWTREECVAAFGAGVAFYAFEVADHYTEYGLVGVLIVDAAGIRQFVMSCRIMGLEAEMAAVAQIGAQLREGGATAMFAAMIETERNQPCRNLYSRCGFEAVEGGWQRALEPWFAVPAHIALTVERAKTEKALATAAE